MPEDLLKRFHVRSPDGVVSGHGVPNRPYRPILNSNLQHVPLHHLLDGTPAHGRTKPADEQKNVINVRTLGKPRTQRLARFVVQSSRSLPHTFNFCDLNLTCCSGISPRSTIH